MIEEKGCWVIFLDMDDSSSYALDPVCSGLMVSLRAKVPKDECGEEVLVVCYGGINRAPAVCMWIMLSGGADFLACYETLLSSRGRVLQNWSFRRQLCHAWFSLSDLSRGQPSALVG